MRRIGTIIAWLLFIGVITATLNYGGVAEAQFGSLKKKVEKKVEKKADQETDKAVDKAVDETYDAAVDAATGSGDSDESGETTEKAPADNTTESKSTGTSGGSGGSASSKSAASGGGGASAASAAEKMKPGEGAWVNYDFVPGDRVIYSEDFSKTPVGDVPRRIEYIKGNMEVAEWNGKKYFKINGDGEFEVPLPNVLPEEFTVEVEAYLPHYHALYIYPGSTAPKTQWSKTDNVRFGSDGNGRLVGGLGRGWSSEISYDDVGKDVGLFNIRIMMNGTYIKVYGNEKRLSNVPNAEFARCNRLAFQVDRQSNNITEGVLIGRIRIAEGGKKFLYDELEANGRVATQGIYFDVDSDNLRPESTPTLSDMGSMLKEHADLRLLIEGHTDSQGDDAHNQDLSERRAAAVRSYLVSNYGVDGGRLETKGFGESKPVASNDTPEGRQNNRRVELVKLN